MTAVLAEHPTTALQPLRRGGRRRLVRALLAVVLLLPVAWVVAQATYRPLDQGGGILAFGVVGEGFRVTPQQTITNSLGSEFRVSAPAVGTRVGMAFGLHNSGRTGVEVLDVAFPDPGFYTGSPETFTSMAPGGSGLPYAPFRPLHLAPGESREVGASVVLTGCTDGPGARNGGANVYGSVPVTWRWLGRTHVTQVALDFRGWLDRMPVCAS